MNRPQTAIIAALICCGVNAQSLNGLWQGFHNAQDTTRTKVWWFHGETETTREGITADLEAFRDAGVGGVVYYDQVHGGGEQALDAFSPEWWRMFCFAASEAKRLRLTFETHLSNGYVAGGPWITPRLGMKMLVAADTVVSGGMEFHGVIPLPIKKGTYHSDVAVLAFPCPEDGWTGRKMLTHRTIKAEDRGKHTYITIDMGRAFTARSISYQVNGRIKTATRSTNVPGPPAEKFYGTGYFELPKLGELEVSDDGVSYREVAKLKPSYNANTVWKRKTVAFPAATGRYFRLNLHDWWPDDDPKKDMTLRDVVLSPAAMVDLWPEKAGLISDHIFGDDTPDYKSGEVIDPAAIIDISDRQRPDGVLRWQVPQGKWVIMRFACVPTGAKTKHGRKNLLGLECDKMSREAAEAQWKNYYKVMADTLISHGLRIDGLAMDSHEAGAQNWTEGFEREFRRLRGYDLMRYLPVMAGYVVGDARRSAGILYDVRRTVADLISYRYFATLDSLCRSAGVRFTAQAVGNGLAITGDPIQAKGRVDKPQGEFWAQHPDGNYDIKECSSAAHVYGKPIASGEAFTDAKFSHSPAYIKSLADGAYCYGLNEFVVCASAYQPWTDRQPGSTGGGRQYCLNRNSTYWPYLRPFWDYQSRCSYMMRQGRSVNDLCVYIGENAPVKIMTFCLPDIPSGIDFDACTTDALLSCMRPSGGRAVLPTGAAYQMMVLPRSGELTLKALRKMAEMVRRGLPLYGTKPAVSPSAADLDSLGLWRALVDEMWGDGRDSIGRRCYGQGKIFWGMPLAEAMAEVGVVPDISMKSGDMKERKIWFAHRSSADAEIYFINNHGGEAVADTFVLRSGRRMAEWWDAVTATRHALPSTALPDGRTAVALALAAHEAGFVVLSDSPTDGLPVRRFLPKEEIAPIKGEWDVWFNPEKGGRGSVKMAALADWTQSPDTATRYYSGTALYRNTFRYRQGKVGEQVMLRFDSIGDIARVTVNGSEAGVVWCSPWQIDITWLVKKGENRLEIEVANSLMNRMILDSSLPETERITYAYPIVAKPTDRLCASGLLGNVYVVKR